MTLKLNDWKARGVEELGAAPLPGGGLFTCEHYSSVLRTIQSTQWVFLGLNGIDIHPKHTAFLHASVTEASYESRRGDWTFILILRPSSWERICVHLQLEVQCVHLTPFTLMGLLGKT